MLRSHGEVQLNYGKDDGGVARLQQGAGTAQKEKVVWVEGRGTFTFSAIFSTTAAHQEIETDKLGAGLSKKHVNAQEYLALLIYVHEQLMKKEKTINQSKQQLPWFTLLPDKVCGTFCGSDQCGLGRSLQMRPLLSRAPH